MTYEYFDQRYFYQGVCDSYSFIRQSQGQLKQVNFTESVKTPLKTLKQIKSKLINIHKNKNPLAVRYNNYYQKGYQFHQYTVRQNPQLLDWVLRKDYWDYKLPLLNITHD